MLKTLETSTKASCFTYKYLYVFPWDFVMISPWCDFEMITDSESRRNCKQTVCLEILYPKCSNPKATSCLSVGENYHLLYSASNG